jgi:HD-GYP domain-containing protein (c-di-GMP phosphodiesterase class II)
MLGDHDYYTYSHSVRVAAFSTVIAMQMGLTNVDQLREIALGAMLHDLGKKDIPLLLINKTGPLTEEEWKLFRAHPENGHKHMGDILKSTVPIEIILHHHEKNDGSGYPHGLDRSSLLPEVQIATMADVFDALTSSRSYQNKRSRFEALDFIRHNLLGVKLSREPFQALVSSLIA